ncbi:hypothetical protein KKG71_05735 [Patescibacteria group bacterium]|nr:hypothetical protein [Patescibacteria group bacterium]
MNEDTACKLCKSPNCKKIKNWSKNTYETKCKSCGTYRSTDVFDRSINTIEDNVVHLLSSSKEQYDLYIIQGAIREHNISNQIPLLTFKDLADGKGMTIDDLLNSVQIPNNPIQKLFKFLENISKINSIPGGEIEVYKDDKNLCYARNLEEFDYILKAANKEGYFEEVQQLSLGKSRFYESIALCSFQLSLAAWGKIEELKTNNIKSKQGFIACSFDDDHKVFSDAIADAIKATGFEPMMIKEKNYPETVISKGLGGIKKSRFVIVDLTNLSNSVFFEAGFSLGKNIEVIFVIHENQWGELREFYSKNYNIKKYKDADHLKELIKAAINERIL